MLSNRFRVLLGGLVVGLSLVGSGLSPVHAASPEPIQLGLNSPCQDVVVLGAQGSGQTYEDHQGFGAEAWHGFTEYAKEMDGYKIGYRFVPYPAFPVSDLLLTSGSTRKLFFESIDDGVAEALTFLTQREKICRGQDEHYVFMGYSQGAMVMHRLITYLALTPRAEHLELAYNLLPSVDGVLAIADGDKVSNQGGLSFGTAPDSGSGITWAGNAVAKPTFEYPPYYGSIPNLNVWPAQRFHSICQREDLVCDASGFGKRTWWGGLVKNYIDFKRSMDIHTASYSPGGVAAGHVRTAAWNIADTSKALKPTPNPTPIDNTVLETVPVRVGQRGVVGLVSDGWDVASVEWLSDPIPNAQLSPGQPTIPATLRWTPTTVETVNYSVRVTYLDGRQEDLTGSLQSFAVPTPSLSVSNVQTSYIDGRDQFGAYVTKVTADISKTASSDTTPVGMHTWEDSAGPSFAYTSGDENANGMLDLGETWSYEAYFPWYEWELRNEINYTVIVNANDSTGAGGFVDTEFGITLTR